MGEIVENNHQKQLGQVYADCGAATQVYDKHSIPSHSSKSTHIFAEYAKEAAVINSEIASLVYDNGGEKSPANSSPRSPTTISKDNTPEKSKDILPLRTCRPVIRHSVLGNRQRNHDPNLLVEAVTFTSLGKIQPFLVTVATNAALILDFHCHLTTSEVVGFLAGNWDINAHNVTISHAFPCKARLGDFTNGPIVESEIMKRIKSLNLTLLGWYHSHPNDPATPTLRDIDTQLDYELKMRGTSDSTYIPCVGLICSPYCTLNTTLESQLVCYWVAPPPDARVYEYGKPMMMMYSVHNDDHIDYDTLVELKACVDFYKGESDFVSLSEQFGNTSFMDKLKGSLIPKFPRNHQETPESLWNYLVDILMGGKSPDEILKIIIDIANVPAAVRSKSPELPKLIIPEIPMPVITPPKMPSHETRKSPRGRGKRSSSTRETQKHLPNFNNYFVGSDLANALFSNPLMGWDPTALSLLNLNPLSLSGMFMPPLAPFKQDSNLMKPPPPPSSFYPYASPSSKTKRPAASSSPSSKGCSGGDLKVPKIDVSRTENSPSPSSSQ